MAIIRRRFDPAVPARLTEREREPLDALTPDDIERNARNDSDNPPLTDEELSRVAIARRVQAARAASGLSQTAFAERFHINLARLRDWEQGRFQPDSVALAYLAVIESDPTAVVRALEGGQARS